MYFYYIILSGDIMKIKMEMYQPKKQLFNDIIIIDCGYEICSPSHSFGPHKRDYYLIHFIIDGQGEFNTNNKAFVLSKNQGFLICPDQITTYTADRVNPWHYYWVGFKGAYAESILNLCGISKDNPVFCYEKNNNLKKHIINLYHNSKLMKWNNLTMLGHLYHFFAYLSDETYNNNNDLQQKYIEQALNYIQNYFMQDITIDSLSKNLFIHRSYLYKLFKQKFNISPVEYLNNFRLEKASSLLLLSNHSITDIAIYCGFKSSSLFCKAFKKKFNMKALEYRKTR